MVLSQSILKQATRILSDYFYSSYRSDMLSQRPLTAGLSSTPITFPNPNPTSFAVLKQNRQGHPQVSEFIY